MATTAQKRSASSPPRPEGVPISFGGDAPEQPPPKVLITGNPNTIMEMKVKINESFAEVWKHLQEIRGLANAERMDNFTVLNLRAKVEQDAAAVEKFKGEFETRLNKAEENAAAVEKFKGELEAKITKVEGIANQVNVLEAKVNAAAADAEELLKRSRETAAEILEKHDGLKNATAAHEQHTAQLTEFAAKLGKQKDFIMNEVKIIEGRLDTGTDDAMRTAKLGAKRLDILEEKVKIVRSDMADMRAGERDERRRSPAAVRHDANSTSGHPYTSVSMPTPPTELPPGMGQGTPGGLPHSHSSARSKDGCTGHCFHVTDLLANEIDVNHRLEVMELRWSSADSTVEQANHKFGLLKTRVEDLDRALQAYLGDAWERSLANQGNHSANTGAPLGNSVPWPATWAAGATSAGMPAAAASGMPSAPCGAPASAHHSQVPGFGVSGAPGAPLGNPSFSSAWTPGPRTDPRSPMDYNYMTATHNTHNPGGQWGQPNSNNEGWNPPSGSPYRQFEASRGSWGPEGPTSMGTPLGAQGSGWNPEAAKPMTEYTKVFEEKTAQNNSYDGSIDKGAAWLKWTKLYFIGNCPDVERLLQMSESAPGKITSEHVRNLDHPDSPFKTSGSATASMVSSHIWRYLNQATTARARAIFENLEHRNGLEAWRRIYRHVHKGTPLHKHTLGVKIQQPAKYLKDAGNLALGVDQWEADIQAYVETGGQAPPQDQMIMNLCGVLPPVLRDNLLWRTHEFQDYSHFKYYVIEQAERLEHFGGKSSVNFVGAMDEEQLMEELEQKATDFPELSEALAVLRDKRNQRNGARQRPPYVQPPPRALPGVTRDRDRGDRDRKKTKCINCGGDHQTALCRAAKREKTDRPCWTCGKTGHVSAQCPEKKSGTNLLQDDDKDLDCFIVSEGDEYQEIKSRPRPQGVRLADFITTPTHNRWKALESPDEPHTNATSTIPNEADNMVERCHGCGWQGVSEKRQVCPDCHGQQCLSAAVLAHREKQATRAVHSAPKPSLGSFRPSTTPGRKLMDVTDLMDSLTMTRDEDGRVRANVEDVEKFCEMLHDSAHILEYDADDVLAAEDGEIIIEVTIDSGSVEHVMNREEVPTCAVLESPGSRMGKNFMAANGTKLPNEGEFHLEVHPEGSMKGLNAVVQAANVTRPLFSVSKICDASTDTEVTFNSKICQVKKGGRLVATFYRKGGLYTAKMRVNDRSIKKDSREASSFPRQGVKR